jgi:hypothetical protein
MILRVHQRPLKHKSNTEIRNTDIIFVMRSSVLCKSGPVPVRGSSNMHVKIVEEKAAKKALSLT